MNIRSKSWILIGVGASLMATAAQSQTSAPPGGLNVKVTNTPSVTVANPTSDPVPVAIANGPPVTVKPAETPFSVDVVGNCNDVNCFIDFPAVPAGKMLVIKHVSTIARPNAGAIFDFAQLVASNTETDGIGTRFTFPMTRIGLAGSSVLVDTYGANGPVLAFVREGQIPRLTLTTHVSGPILFAQGTLSGYMIDAPQ